MGCGQVFEYTFLLFEIPADSKLLNNVSASVSNNKVKSRTPFRTDAFLLSHRSRSLQSTINMLLFWHR
jgi:hypothetical protein